jgi:hypothetical protein
LTKSTLLGRVRPNGGRPRNGNSTELPSNLPILTANATSARRGRQKFPVFFSIRAFIPFFNVFSDGKRSPLFIRRDLNRLQPASVFAYFTQTTFFIVRQNDSAA